MIRLAGLCALVSGLAGCTIIFNSSDLPTIADAAVDAPPPDAVQADATIFDVNPGGLALTSVDPTVLVEGTGTAGGRPVMIVVQGSNIDATATISIVAGADAVPNGLAFGATVVSQMHDMAAAPVTVPVIALGDGMTLGLKVRVTNPGNVMMDLPITLDGLDSFAPAAGNFDVKNLKPLYSDATFGAATHFIQTTSAKPAHVRVTGGITITAVVNVDGAGQAQGPGGCGGAGASAPGDCTPGGGGGGGGGVSGVSGGGGGFGDAGKQGGGGAGAGTAGMTTGDPMLVKLDYSGTAMGNRGNGGGGGGGATLGLGTPGVGGGGGGTLELTAGGTITITGAGAARAQGGNGTKGSGVGPGDGGAGAGGAILIRSGGGVSAPGTWLSAPAGGVSGGAGGAGGAGRIRVDTPTGSVAAMASTPAASQGPSWAIGASGAPTIVRTPQINLPLIGQNGQSYGILVGGNLTSVSFTGTTMKSVPVTLVAGNNNVCAVADAQTSSAANDVALECIDVVYLP